MSGGHVFVSHSSDNREQATELAAYLEGRGAKVWIAPRDVRPGRDYSEQLQEAIESSAAFVVLVTDMGNKSPYVRAETEMAFSTHKPIFPVRTSDIQPASGLALFLKIRHWTDAFGPGRDAALDRLATELQTLCPTDLSDPAPALASEAEEVAPPTPPATPPPPPQSPPPPPPAEPPTAAPPASSPPPRSPEIEPLPSDAGSEERWRAAIGPNADYYLSRWRAMEASGSKRSWNWPACLANLFWLAYRKMWLPLGIFLLTSFVISLLGMASSTMGKVSLVMSIGLTFVTGAFGNYLYRQQTGKLVAETARIGGPDPLRRLATRGGVSVAALVISLAVIGLVAILMVLATLAAMRQQPIGPTPIPGPSNLVQDPSLAPDDKPPEEALPTQEEVAPEYYEEPVAAE